MGGRGSDCWNDFFLFMFHFQTNLLLKLYVPRCLFLYRSVQKGGIVRVTVATPLHECSGETIYVSEKVCGDHSSSMVGTVKK